MNTVIILIPGTTGTTLLDSTNHDAVAWGGKTSEFQKDVKAHNPQAGDALLEGTLAVGTPSGWQSAGSAPGQKLKGYGVFEAYFAAAPYQFSTAVVSPTEPVPNTLAARQLIGFAYDWRADNTDTARLLQRVLEQVDTAYAGQPYETWLVGHSMGGLIARAVLEPNAGSSETWYQSIKGLITLGTPHLGAPLALSAILGKFPDFMNLLVHPDEVTAVQTFVNYTATGGELYDSTYELLPPSAQALLDFIVAEPGGVKRSVFDLQSEITGSSAANLAGAQAFFKSLTYGDAEGLPPYYCAYGSLLLTTIGYTYDANAKTWTPANEVAGDLIVPKASAQFSGRTLAGQQEFPHVNHIALPSNAKVLQYIATNWMQLQG